MIWINPFHIAGGPLNVRVQLQGSPASDPAGIRSMKPSANLIRSLSIRRTGEQESALH